MRDEITLPLLDCGDIARTFGESREAYMRWKGTLTSKARDPEVLLDHENAKDTILTPMFNAHRTALGDAALKACRESVSLYSGGSSEDRSSPSGRHGPRSRGTR